MIEPFRKSTGEVLQTIQGELSPYVGSLMARTAAAAHCRDLGFYDSVLDHQQIAALLQKIRLGLVIFLGKEKTEEVIDDMQRAISRLGETH